MNTTQIHIHTVIIIAAMSVVCGCSKKSTDDAATPKEKPASEIAASPSPEEQMKMTEEAKKQALAEFGRHFTNINGCWYASVLKRSETMQMTNVTPVVRGAFAFKRTDGGSRWYGDVVMEAELVRTFSTTKQTWTPWRRLASEKQLTYTTMNSNGTWVVENAYGDFFTIPKSRATR